MATKHPESVSDYLNALVWDGTPRIDRWLIDSAGAADTPYVRAVSRAALVAAVRRARHPGCKFDEMLVIQGPRGTGKSLALCILAISDDWFSNDIPLEPRGVIESTANKWIVELSDSSRLKHGDLSALKTFLDARTDVAIPLYKGGCAVTVPRSFVVVGTTSKKGYFPNPTADQQFWPVRVERFDLDRLRADRDQLWAEAASAEVSGESITIASLAETTENQHAFVVIGDQFGVEFSSHSLDVACSFVSGKLREQAENSALMNPTSYRIKQVKAG